MGTRWSLLQVCGTIGKFVGKVGVLQAVVAIASTPPVSLLKDLLVEVPEPCPRANARTKG